MAGLFATLHPKDPSVLRTNEAGSLRADQTGQTVTLAGWVARRRDHGGVAFLDLRDASGVVQVVARDEVLAQGGAHDIRNEYCVQVTGEVRRRPEGNENPDLPTGEVEVVASAIDVLNPSAPLPFQIDERVNVGEESRLKYRYLDLRRPAPGAAIRLRSKVNAAARAVLDAHDFVEIETPTMTRSTPEGARDFIVPARLAPGSWYALPQSPQLFKQLLMVAGMERYYQIARCYRDEDFRADRQPEFTQLDIEMSFVEEEDVLALGEEVAVALWKLIGVDVPTPMPRLTYAEAMARYGTDKPDTRFANELVECTEFFKDTAFRVFQQPYVGAVVMPGGASQPRKQLDGWQEWAKQRGAPGLAYVLVQEDGSLGGGVAKFLTETEAAGLAAHVGAVPGDCIFFGAGAAKASRALLGAARLEIGYRCGLIEPGSWGFLWVNDAPLFEPASDAVASGDVAVGVGRVDRGAPRVHVAQEGVPRHLRHGAGVRARVRVRHGLQRQRDRRRVHPYPPPRRPGARLRGDGPQRGGRAGEVRVPPRRVPVRRAAARRDRVRMGPDLRAAVRLRLDPGGHRVPEVRRRLRPAHRGAGTHHRAAAHGGRGRRATQLSVGRHAPAAKLGTPSGNVYEQAMAQAGTGRGTYGKYRKVKAPAQGGSFEARPEEPRAR